MKALRWSGAAAMALCLMAGSCEASTVFSENFNSGTFSTTAANSTERSNGNVLSAFTVSGWTKEGSTSQILGFDQGGSNYALWLNESGATPNGLSRTITGLVVGAVHTLSFDYWGDNVTGPYTFNFEVNGVTTGVSQVHTGQNTGTFHTRTFQFTPTTTTTTLRFAETAVATSSPVIDNVVITAADPTPSAVPEPGSMALFGTGAAALAFLRKRRK